MGQQQLLLLVLGLVIVGFAVVTGIQAFEENNRKARYDRFTQEAVAVAGDVVAWYQKPTALGGAGNGRDVLGSTLSLQQLGRSQTEASSAQTSFTGTDYRLNLVRELESVRIDLMELPEAERAILVQLRLYGVPSGCWALRRSEYRDGAWQYDDSELAKPDGCSWSPD
ncbi:MAG: hypothetical protein AAGG50_19315 [Bacteroidota bacterium]